MSSYSVADAKNRLPSLIDKAMQGEEVIITRHGKPVVELRPAAPVAEKASDFSYEWVKQRRAQWPAVNITSVELLNELYEEDEG